ncbi:CMP-sialic acid transporter-like [Haemaphysalis longicornis]
MREMMTALPAVKMAPDNGDGGGGGSSLERKVASLRFVVALSMATTVTDVTKMVCSYSLQYRNKGRYPLQQTLLVALVEALKCLLVTAMHVATSGSLRMRPSPKFLLPSLIYTLTNNIFFFALHYVTPAVWIVLVQCKIIITLCVYKHLFNRTVTRAQWVAGALIILAVLTSQAGSFVEKGASSAGLFALLLALMCGSLSTIAAVYTEYFFKNDGRSLWEQQSQIYFGSALISAAAALLVKEPLVQRDQLVGHVVTFLVATVVSSGVHGLCVALVVARLDNIVKYHLSATSSLLNSVASAVLFPDAFSVTPAFAASLATLMAAIFLYERRSFAPPQWLAAAFRHCWSWCNCGWALGRRPKAGDDDVAEKLLPDGASHA